MAHNIGRHILQILLDESLIDFRVTTHFSTVEMIKDTGGNGETNIALHWFYICAVVTMIPMR